MINRLKRWIAKVAHDHDKVVPSVVERNAPFITVYKIGNGYLFHKGDTRPYRSEEDATNVVYCANILDVCRQMINKEALQKLGIKDEPTLHTHGVATASFNKDSTTGQYLIRKPINPNTYI